MPDEPAPEPPAQDSPEPQRQLQPQWEDAYADPPTEPIPVVAGPEAEAHEPEFQDSEAETQQWTMDPPPHADPAAGSALARPDDAYPGDAYAAGGYADGDVDSDAPTQQWTMAPPPADRTEPAPTPPADPPPSGPPPEPPAPRERSYEPPPPPPNNNMRWVWAAAGVVVVGAVIAVAYFTNRPSEGTGSQAAPPTVAAPTTEPVKGCDYPAQVLDLTGWNVSLPVAGPPEQKDDDEGEKSDAEKAADKAAGKDAEKKAKEVNQPELATFVAKPFFQVNSTCDGVAFRAPVNGITTSGSKYPRSELREMSPDGSRTASWTSSTGAHTFVVNEAFTALPQGKPNLVGVQIHDEDDDVSTFRLEGTNLYITEGDDTHHKLVTDKYVLGTRYEAKYIVSGDVIQAFYNGQLQTTISKQFTDAYFKAGAYTQANCTDYTVQCNGSSYGETTVYSLHVEHS